jgi:two-component system NtrC family sensor kinase
MNQHYGRALVIDDDALFRELCAETLRRSGFSVEARASTAEVLDLFRAGPFDLVILDLYLPDTDGLSLLEQLRERRIAVPILLISGGATVEQAARAMRLGARGLLLKPFKAEELRAAALEIAGERRAARSRDRAAALRPAVRVGERLLAELDLPRLQNQIIETVRSELDSDRASLMLIEDGGASLRIVACSGLPPHIEVGHRVPIAGSLAGAVAARRQPVRIDAEGEVTPPAANLRGELFEDKILSALCVPVMARDRVLGVLNAAKVRASQPFTEADQELLVLLAAQAAIAIENARLYTSVAQSEARYRALLQHATDSVLLLDDSGCTILDANLALENLSGYSRAELLGMDPGQIFPEVAALMAVAPRNGRGNGGPEAQEIETELRTRAEIGVQVAVSVSTVPHEGQQLRLVIARDISERQRLAKQLVQTEKLAALGRLSASLAHEINNPLQAIHNSVHLMLSRPLSEEKRQTYLTMTQDEIERLISIVQRTLDFYRPNRDGMRPVDVNEIIDAVLTLTEGQLHEHRVQVVREGDGPPRLPWVFAVSGHLKQVCFNLIFNAVEAMPEGGELRVRTYVEEPGDDDGAGFVRVGGRGASDGGGPWVVIEIADSGAGIPEHELPKIFEPFYTTRFKGTGLGLAVSYSIVEQHHGDMAVRSAPGAGTTFRVRLPIAQ